MSQGAAAAVASQLDQIASELERSAGALIPRWTGHSRVLDMWAIRIRDASATLRREIDAQDEVRDEELIEGAKKSGLSLSKKALLALAVASSAIADAPMAIEHTVQAINASQEAVEIAVRELGEMIGHAAEEAAVEPEPPRSSAAGYDLVAMIEEKERQLWSRISDEERTRVENDLERLRVVLGHLESPWDDQGPATVQVYSAPTSSSEEDQSSGYFQPLEVAQSGPERTFRGIFESTTGDYRMAQALPINRSKARTLVVRSSSSETLGWVDTVDLVDAVESHSFDSK